jgi:hypothetical protein
LGYKKEKFGLKNEKYYFLQWLFLAFWALYLELLPIIFGLKNYFSALFFCFVFILMDIVMFSSRQKLKKQRKSSLLFSKKIFLFPKKEQFDDLKNASVKFIIKAKKNTTSFILTKFIRYHSE